MEIAIKFNTLWALVITLATKAQICEFQIEMVAHVWNSST